MSDEFEKSPLAADLSGKRGIKGFVTGLIILVVAGGFAVFLMNTYNIHGVKDFYVVTQHYGNALIDCYKSRSIWEAPQCFRVEPKGLPDRLYKTPKLNLPEGVGDRTPGLPPGNPDSGNIKGLLPSVPEDGGLLPPELKIPVPGDPSGLPFLPPAANPNPNPNPNPVPVPNDPPVEPQPSNNPAQTGQPAQSVPPENNGSGDSNESAGGGFDKNYAIQLAQNLPVQQSQEVEYSRKNWKHWVGSPCNTREKVLVAQGESVKIDPESCKVLSGTWTDPYSNTVLDSPKTIDIDHVIPLGYAATHGGFGWSGENKQAFANDMNNLLAVSARENRRKSDKGPGEYMPPNTDYHCEYSVRWTNLVYQYQLFVSQSDKDTIVAGVQSC